MDPGRRSQRKRRGEPIIELNDVLKERGDERERLAKEHTVLYDRGGQAVHPLTLYTGVIEGDMLEADMKCPLKCPHCYFEWHARYVEGMDRLTCPRCLVMGANTPEDWAWLMEQFREAGIEHKPDLTPEEARLRGDIGLGLVEDPNPPKHGPNMAFASRPVLASR